MRSTPKLLLLPLLAAASTSAHACGGPGPCGMALIFAICFVPGLLVGLATGALSHMNYLASLVTLGAALASLQLGLLGLGIIDNLNGFLIVLCILMLLNATTHALGYFMVSGSRSTAEPAPAAQPQAAVEPPAPEDDETLMRRHNIQPSGAQFTYGPYRYDRLADAIAYATQQAARSRA